MKKLARVLAVTALGLAATGAARAQSPATTTFQVTASVSAACSVTAGDLVFGAYSATAGNLDQTSTIVVTCTSGLPYGVSVGATPTTRTMLRTGGGGSLDYGMFSDGTYGTAFGVTGAIGSGAAQNHTVFGRIGASQFVPVGNYADTVTVSVNY